MLNMRKGPLYEMLGQATQQQLAQPRTSTTPPIWQGRGLNGDPVSVLSRNPDGTFQALIQGQEKTRTERDIAQMLNLRKGPLHEMLGQATKNMGQTPPNVQTDLDGGSQPTSKPKKRFRAKMEDTSTSDGHLNPGLPSHQSPKNMADAQTALSPLVSKSDEYARRWEAVQSRLDQVRDYVAAKPGTPSKPPFLQTATERAEKTRLSEEMRALIKEEASLRQEQDRLAADARAILAIPESERGKVRFTGTNLENFSPELAKVWKTAREGALLVEQYIHPDLLPEVGIHTAFHNRSGYNHRNDQGDLVRTAFLTPGAGVITAAHEITHAIECQEIQEQINGQWVSRQPWYERARNFLLQRARGVPPESLQHLDPDGNYEPHEMAFEDDWANRGGEHYTGRDYPHSMTEIFTMGLQRLHDDPVRFMSEDPEHFAIVLQLRYPTQP